MATGIDPNELPNELGPPPQKPLGIPCTYLLLFSSCFEAGLWSKPEEQNQGVWRREEGYSGSSPLWHLQSGQVCSPVVSVDIVAMVDLRFSV
jgi:hypothetical protein